MNELLDGNVLNIYSDKVNISFKPKTNTDIKSNNDKDKEKDYEEVGKSKVIAIILALFLGRYGIHKFYLGKPGVGLLYLLFSRFDIVMLIGLIDAYIYFRMDNDTWLKEFGTRKIKKKKK